MSKWIVSVWGVASLLGLLPALGGCAPPLARYEFAEVIMGVEARITLYAGDADAARAAARAGFDRMNELDAVMSDYRADSELMRLCDAAPGPVPASDDLLAVLDRALAISAASGGAFDVTVGPLVRVWRAARRDGRRPDPERLAAARALTGADLVAIDRVARTVTLARAGMRLDLGGIGKGYAADAAVRAIAAAGSARCLVDLGGDIAAGAPPPGRAAWRIAVESPGGSGTTTVVDLARAGVATSGDTRQFVEVDGVHYSHIVDPRTGLGLTNRVSVTVIAPDAATADALASAVSVLGPGRGIALVAGDPAAEALVEQWIDGAWRSRRTDGFP